MGFARVSIEMNINGEFLDKIVLDDERDVYGRELSMSGNQSNVTKVLA